MQVESLLPTLQRAVGVWLLPAIVAVGIVLNTASIVLLCRNKLGLRKAIVILFIVLSIFDGSFLLCAFIIFGLPNICTRAMAVSVTFLVPYVMPVLQTCLTASVYSTVAIVVFGMIIVGSALEETCPRLHDANVASAAAVVIFVVSALFNVSRWLELEVLERASESAEGDARRRVELRLTALRTDRDYVQYYSLIGSSIVMLVVPFIVLSIVCVRMRRSIVAEASRRRMLRIITIITVMFMVCHIPKIILTVYEVAFFRQSEDGLRQWSSWAKAVTELSHLLLVAYSAFNPLAYCGDLFLCTLRGVLAKVGRRCCLGGIEGGAADSDRMESFRNTTARRSADDNNVSGAATAMAMQPAPHRLHELDAQSRLLCGVQDGQGVTPV